MSSRRVMQRSYSGDGRSGVHNADDVSSSSRPANRSYLSNVRPESSSSNHRYSQYRPARSTLCSVMAQLTEETQPTFELTLRSKSVSEKCKVSFTCEVKGHPIPDVIWYKDDVQLDRYCGLPKYEILRNGPNHSLHIYNCTMEDAAIYQASARNTKGIVSCSGVLEVGLMNEYLIHQRYFSKLKQKAGNRRRELEGQRNQGASEQEPLRNLSPEPLQRKRRSPMAPHFSGPGSTEEASKTPGECRQAPGPGSEAAAEGRLQDSAASETVAKHAPGANPASGAPAVNGHAGVAENGGKGSTYMYDSVQKVFTAHQPKTPLAKKKIKLSNKVEGVQEKAQTEGVSKERSSNASARETRAHTELVNSQGPSQEVMAVKSCLPSTLPPAPPAITEPGQKRTTQTALIVDKPPSKDKKSLGRAARRGATDTATQKEKPIPNTPHVDANVSPAGTLQKHDGVHGSQGERDNRVCQETVGHGDTKKTNLESRSQKPPEVSPAQRQQPAHTTNPKPPLTSDQRQKTDIKHSDVTAVDSAVEPTATELPTLSTASTQQSRTDGNIAAGLPEFRLINFSDFPRPRWRGATLRRSRSAGDAEDAFPWSPGELWYRQETNPCRENVALSGPQQPAEVTQANPQPNGAGAPVGLRVPDPRCAVDSPSPQRTPSEEETAAAGGQKPIAHSPPQETRWAARDSPEGGVERKVEGHQAGTLQSYEEHQAPSKREVEMGADAVVLKEIEQAQIGSFQDESLSGCVLITPAGVSRTEITNEALLKSTVDSLPIMHKTNITSVDTHNQRVASDPIIVNVPDTKLSDQQINPLKDSPKPESIVLSVADMMRFQMKALDSPLSNIVTAETNSAAAESIPFTPLCDSSTKQEAATEKCQDLREKLEKVHDMQRALAIPVEVKIEKKPPEQAPKPTLCTTNAIASFNNPSNSVEGNVKGQDPERTNEIEQVEAKPIPPTPTPEELRTPTAPTTEVTTSLTRGEELGKGDDVVRPIEIQRKIEAKPVSTAKVLTTKDQQVELQPTINQTVYTPEQPQLTSVPDKALTSFTAEEDHGKELIVEKTQTTDCKAEPPLTPTPPTSEAIISFGVPPITVSDTERIADTGTPYSGMEKYSTVDRGHECGTSSPVSLGESPDVPPAAAVDENTTVTCCSNASLGSGSSKVLRDSNSPVIMAQEPRKKLSSVEAAIDTTESCCTEESDKIGPSLEHRSPKHLHGTDEGFKQIPHPELELNSEINLKSMPVLSAAGVDTHNIPELNRSSEETKQQNMIQQEKNLSVTESTTVAITPPVSPSNSEAPLQEARSNAPTFASATPKELALGARRKTVIPKSKAADDKPTSPIAVDGQLQSEEVLPKPSKAPPGPATLSVPPGLSQQSLLAAEPNGQRTPPVRRRSPLLSRKAVAQETPAVGKETLQQNQEPKSEEKSAEKEKHDPFKAPQVIRKIRGESFSDASGHLKLWCQFFNVLSDSVISWYRDDVEVAQVKRSAGDETPVNLAIVQASKKDCGVYGCKITNDHGTDITDILLSVEILAGMRLREDIGVGEEIEMTPLVLNKGVADSGVWGSKFFGRVMVQESHIGGGCSRKTWRAKVVYGLEPVFESGTTCVIKMCNRIAYGGKGEAQLTERNVELERQRCRIQSLAREYCKIFSAESRVIENFGPCLEVIPVYLMYRPANTVPYATVEAELKGVYLRYCKLSAESGLVSRTGSEVELKCCALQHWIHQWTNGNLLLTQLEGVDNKLTNVGISVKSTGYQGLSAVGNPDLLEQFVSQHQCNYYCGLLSLRSLKPTDSLQMPSSKSRGSRSPLLQRKTPAGAHSPHTARKAAVSPRLPRKADGETDVSRSPEVNPSNITS